MSGPLSPIIEWRAFKDLTRIVLTSKGVEPRTWHADGFDDTIMTCGSIFGSAPVAWGDGATPQEALAVLESCTYAVNFDGELMRSPEDGKPLQMEGPAALLQLLRAGLIMTSLDIEAPATALGRAIFEAREAVTRKDLPAAEKQIRGAIEIAQDEGLWIVPGTTIDKTEHTPLGVALRGACEEVVRLRRAGYA